MTRPLALDLFCGAGGASAGLHRVGFNVVGVDIEPQPNYPFAFVQADALCPPFDLEAFDFIWASPPCQAYSWAAKRWDKSYPDLLEETRELLEAWGGPYIIENVVGAPLQNPIRLCGQMFGLEVIRHRLFESNWLLFEPSIHPPCQGLVAAGKAFTVAGHGGDSKDFRYSTWARAMGIDWMTKYELTQSIPPAYSEFIGQQVIDAI